MRVEELGDDSSLGPPQSVVTCLLGMGAGECLKPLLCVSEGVARGRRGKGNDSCVAAGAGAGRVTRSWPSCSLEPRY